MKFKYLLILFLSCFLTIRLHAEALIWHNGKTPITYSIQTRTSHIVTCALNMFSKDMDYVTGKEAIEDNNGIIAIYQLDLITNKEFKSFSKLNIPINKFITKKDAFFIGIRNHKIIVVGSNARGTAYGILELSKMAGVSPWVWWGDVVPQKQNRLLINENFESIQFPSVEIRGISIKNSEFTLQQWDKLTNRNSLKGKLSLTACNHLFQLMLRLHINSLYDDNSSNLFDQKNIRALAEEYEIMNVSPNHITLHQNHKKKNIPAHFIFKDDGFGYITSYKNKQHQKSLKHNGIYYHLSNASLPHDYLWLSTTQPGLIYSQMNIAYQFGAKDIWIAEISNPKVCAYQLSLFMDMAWNINGINGNTIDGHLQKWLSDLFGKKVGIRLTPIMKEFYRLTTIRRPEFMGWNQSSISEKTQPSDIRNTEFNTDEFGNELTNYLSQYVFIKQKIIEIRESIKPSLRDAYFTNIEYPILSATSMAFKQLQAQEAREIARPQTFHHDSEALVSAAKSILSYREILDLTDYYNHKVSNGKWKGMMNAAPGNLSVFLDPLLPDTISENTIIKYAPLFSLEKASDQEHTTIRKGINYDTASESCMGIDMLGRSNKSIYIPNGNKVSYNFTTLKEGEATLYIAIIPTHKIDAHDNIIAIKLDDVEIIKTKINNTIGSRQWAENVLRQQKIISKKLVLAKGNHTLSIESKGNNIFVDEWMIDYEKNRRFYMFNHE